MADIIQDSLLREIDEDLRQEKYARLWKRYGSFVIAGAVLLVAGVAGYQAWQAYDRDRREAAAVAFQDAVTLAETDPAAAQTAFQTLAAEGAGGYDLLAGFQSAALAARQGDWAGAVAAYGRLAAEADDPLFGDLAILLGALHEINAPTPISAPGDVQRRLEPLATDDNPWRHTARELLAVLALNDGDRDGARALFSSLAEDAESPAGIRARAQEMLSAIGES